MSKEHVSHSDIAQFAREKVNLPKEKADQYRTQANSLRDKLQNYLNEHPDFSLKKMILSGSLPKGTALRSLNDIDVACYISGSDAPSDTSALLIYLAEKLRKAFPNFQPEQVQPKTYCVTVSFRGSGLDVDIVPVLYDGDVNWYGKLISQENGSFLETCIPRHLEFIRKRKNKQPDHFSQVIRLAKYWVRFMKQQNSSFRFKSFMVELVMCKLLDQGKDFSNYPEGLQHFFTYLASTDLKEIVYFTDYHSASEIPVFDHRVKIIDPVNPKNNAASRYTSTEAEAIIEAAIDAGDAIDAAMAAITKEKTIQYWQKIFGPSFNI